MAIPNYLPRVKAMKELHNCGLIEACKRVKREESWILLNAIEDKNVKAFCEFMLLHGQDL